MKIVDLNEAKKNLSRLIAEASNGSPFLIAKAGTPLVKVLPIKKQRPSQRTGFLAGAYSIPEDFDQLASEEIENQFHQI